MRAAYDAAALQIFVLSQNSFKDKVKSELDSHRLSFLHKISNSSNIASTDIVRYEYVSNDHGKATTGDRDGCDGDVVGSCYDGDAADDAADGDGARDYDGHLDAATKDGGTSPLPDLVTDPTKVFSIKCRRQFDKWCGPPPNPKVYPPLPDQFKHLSLLIPALPALARAQDPTFDYPASQLAADMMDYSKLHPKGTDGWSKAEVRKLGPRVAITKLVELVAGAFAKRLVVIQMLYNTVRLLGKQSGGERGIAQTSLFHKVASKRSQAAVQQSLGLEDDWDMARPGRSAVEGAIHRSALAEAWALLGHCVGALLWDISSFFDSIEVAILARELLALGCPAWALALAIPVHLAPRAIKCMGATSCFEVILRSVLQGCPLATYFARAYYRRRGRQMVRSCGSVRFYGFLDDFVQLACEKGKSDLHDALVDAALAF